MKPNFCSTCGVKLNDTPAFRPSCGVANPTQSATSVTATEYRVPPVLSSGASAHGHSKVTAVLLTLFIGGFGLLYTFRDKGDFGKFLASFSFGPGFSMLGLALLVGSMGTGEPAGLITGFLFMLFGMFFWSVLPLLTTAMRTQAWYDDYDRKHGAH